MKCIEVDNLTDPYALALTSYAMALYKPTSSFTDVLLERLLDKAIIKGRSLQLNKTGLCVTVLIGQVYL